MGAFGTQDKQTHLGNQLKKLGQSEMYGWDSVNSVWVRMALSPGGEIIVTIDPIPGTTVTTPPDTVVGIGATVALPVIPANTRLMLVQNSGPAGTWVRLRPVGGGAGTGVLMPRLGEQTYGGEGALAAMEVEDVSLAVGGVAVATTITVQFQGD